MVIRTFDGDGEDKHSLNTTLFAAKVFYSRFRKAVGNIDNAHHNENIAHESARNEKFWTTINEFQIIFLSSTPWEAGTKFHVYDRSTDCDKSPKKPHDEEDADATRGAEDIAWGSVYSVRKVEWSQT